MKESKTIYALLGWLVAEPLSGYDLKKKTETYIGEFWYGSFGQIYPLLHKMEKEGLVTMEEEKGEGYPPKKVYSITEKGRTEFQNWINEEPEADLFRSEMMLKLFFGYLGDPQALIGHVKKYAFEAEAKLKHLQVLRDQFESMEAHTPHIPFVRIIVEKGIIVNQGYLEWADKTEKILTGYKEKFNSHQ